ncbi:hypothetical protein L9F63_004862, partial [Diploptera punctata]
TSVFNYIRCIAEILIFHMGVFFFSPQAVSELQSINIKPTDIHRQLSVMFLGWNRTLLINFHLLFRDVNRVFDMCNPWSPL